MLAAVGWFFVGAVEVVSGTEQLCMECHSDASLTLERSGREVSLFVDEAPLTRSAHEGFDCADCHEGLDPEAIPHGDPVPRVNCFGCHDSLADSHRFHPAIGLATEMSDDPAVHCATCHGTHEILATDRSEFAFAKDRLPQACGSCHEPEKTAFLASAHASGNGQPFPNCLSCHAAATPHSSMGKLELKQAQLELCLSCHVDSPEAAERTRLGGRFVASWGSSVHAIALEAGNADSANCVDCHGSHEMKRGMLADSRVNKLHIPETCQSCHAEQANAFAVGVHALALARGVHDSPVCTDCHGEHLILAPDDPRAAVAARNVSKQLCGECHGSARLSARYGIASDRFTTFASSYHGLALSGGAVEVVNCASCHGAHQILRSDNPLSPVNKANLARTCGECHPGANERFAVGTVHVSMEPGSAGNESSDGIVLRVVVTVYVWLIAVVVGGMVIHNLLDFAKKVRRKVWGHVSAPPTVESVPHRLYLRMNVNERLQHGTLVISFVVLVVTGFMLRFPEAWWVQALRDLNSHLFEWRGWLHRAAAVVMVGAGFWHAAYVCFTRRGRELLKDLCPRWRDLRDAFSVLRYNLGLAKTKPRFGRFSYIEKVEYWALLWGSVLMTVTGVLLWADNTTMGVLTKLGFDVARAVHYYEAILATLAIVVWHFYAVIFNPDVYPMNLSWLTGRLSEEEMRHEHPLELERLQREEEIARAQPVAVQSGTEAAEDDRPDTPV